MYVYGLLATLAFKTFALFSPPQSMSLVHVEGYMCFDLQIVSEESCGTFVQSSIPVVILSLTGSNRPSSLLTAECLVDGIFSALRTLGLSLRISPPKGAASAGFLVSRSVCDDSAKLWPAPCCLKLTTGILPTGISPCKEIHCSFKILETYSTIHGGK